jgi:hypothetical protein
MHAKRNIRQIQKILFIFYSNCKKRKSLDKQWCDKKHQKVRRLQFPKPLSIMRFPETSLGGVDQRLKQLAEAISRSNWPKQAAEVKDFLYLAFGFGHQIFRLLKQFAG